MKAKAVRLKKKYAIEVQVTPQKGAFGQVFHYEARLGEWEVYDKTPDAAVAKLQALLELASKTNGLMLTVQWRGYIFIVRWDVRMQQWAVHRVELEPPDSQIMRSGWQSGGYSISDVTSGPRAMAKLQDAVQRDLFQHRWEPLDGRRVPIGLSPANFDELAKWVESSLRYQDAKAKGLSDDDAGYYAGRSPAHRHLWEHEPKEEFKLVQG